MGTVYRRPRRDFRQANRGRPFEEFINFANKSYQARGIACVHKVPTEFLPIRDGTGRVVDCKVEHKSCVDYLGRYKGTPVAVEAKHTDDARIRFDRVEDHQAAYMDDFCKDPGAVGIILVSFSLRRFFAVPWQAWKGARDQWTEAQKSGRRHPGAVPLMVYGQFWNTPGMASVSPEQMLPSWEIHTGGVNGLPYLDIIENWRRHNGNIR